MTYRPLLLLVLLSLLSGCAVYDHFFHPHRLGNPPMTAAAKAKAKAAEKARHKGLTLGAPAADGSTKPAADGASDDGAAGSAATSPPAADAKSADDKNKAIEDMLGNTYNTKTGLLKRSKLQRMQYSRRALHHYDLGAPPHTAATRDARHMRKHPKGKGPDKATDKEDKAVAEAADPGFTPDPTQPAAPKPAAKSAKPMPTAKPAKAPLVTKPAKAPLAKTPAPKPVKAAPAAPKPKVDKAAEAKAKEEKLRAGGETGAKPAKNKKAPKAPKPDPTQPLTGQD